MRMILIVFQKYDISLQELKLNYSELLDSLIKNIE